MPKSSASKKQKTPAPSQPHRPLTGLGRGLTEIIAQGARVSPTPVSSDGITVRQIPLSQIVANPRQPRVHFIEEPLDELVDSIREHGILQPITVRPVENHFEIIAGERRFRASQKAGLQTIPSIVKSVSDIEAYELALVENLQREDLDPIEESNGYQRLSKEFSLTQEEIAKKVGKNRATIANAIRLLDLPQEVQGYLSQKRITIGHAKAILSVNGLEQQIQLAREILKQGYNVRRTESLVSKLRSPSAKKSAQKDSHELPLHLKTIQEALQQKLATRVQIHPSGNGGRVELHYYTSSDLDRLLEFFSIQV